ncbi:MAG: helicase C-terminal domain-containing protein [Spirochaetia bacterium]
MRAEQRIGLRVIEEIREAIADANGNEVFLVGKRGHDGKVESVTVGARGNEEAVPVLSPHLEEGDVIIHNHPSGGITPSGADLAIASRLGNQGIGFFIVDNRLDEVYVVAEPVEAREIAPLDEDALAAGLSPDGALSRLYPLFEERASQVDMLRLVCRAFNGDEICAAEAGTGVGKSLAYLLPAVAWAVQNGERVVVSTNTINLQQQLVEKDIPLVKKVLGQDPKVVLVKGRRNYLCLHRLNEALEEQSLFDERDPDLLAIREWARTTETGSRTDLSFYPPEDAWSRVCSEADACLGLRCSHREGCFVLKARREASSAKILIANHHLLFADLAFRMAGSGFDDPAVLPPFRRLIFDEAHNVEKAASSFFSQSFSRLVILRFLGRLLRRRKGRATGHFPALARRLGRSALAKRVPELIETVSTRAEELDEAGLGLMGEENALLLDAGVMPAFRENVGSVLGNLSFAIRELGEAFSEVFEKLGARETEETRTRAEGEGSRRTTEDDLIWDCRVQLARLSAIADICDRFRTEEIGANDIFWMEALKSGRGEREGKERTVRLVITPLDIGPLMREAVYEPIKTVLFTSATLTVAGSFSFWAGRIGLSGSIGREPLFQSFPSPFNYEERVLLGVPTDAPAPDSLKHKEFLARFIAKALLKSRGAGLVLFTSYSLLRDVYAASQEELGRAGIRMLKQGDDDRARLLDAFRAERSSVLFATDSFWEGVDAPGETLQVVILCRLPFRVPSEPVLKARMMAIEERGGNPFGELSLPDAVVRMRQGFGRLMRRYDDTGVVLILDPRIVTKQYGAVFLDSLPRTMRTIAPAAEVLRSVASFFGQKKEEEDDSVSSSAQA